MNKQLTGLILIIAMLVLMPLHGYAATPKETVEEGVNKVIGILSDPAFKAKNKDEKITIIGTEIDNFFDFKELSRRTLGKSWKKMSAEQQPNLSSCLKSSCRGSTPTGCWLTRTRKLFLTKKS